MPPRWRRRGRPASRSTQSGWSRPEAQAAAFRLPGDAREAVGELGAVLLPVAEAVRVVVARETAPAEPAVVHDEAFGAERPGVVHQGGEPRFREVEADALPGIEDDVARGGMRHEVRAGPAVQRAGGVALPALRPREDELRKDEGAPGLQDVRTGKVGRAGGEAQLVGPFVADADFPDAAPAEGAGKDAPGLLRRGRGADGEEEGGLVLPGVVDAGAGAEDDLPAAEKLVLRDVGLVRPLSGERQQVEPVAEPRRLQAEGIHAGERHGAGLAVRELDPGLEDVAVVPGEEMLDGAEGGVPAVGEDERDVAGAGGFGNVAGLDAAPVDRDVAVGMADLEGAAGVAEAAVALPAGRTKGGVGLHRPLGAVIRGVGARRRKRGEVPDGPAARAEVGERPHAGAPRQHQLRARRFQGKGRGALHAAPAPGTLSIPWQRSIVVFSEQGRSYHAVGEKL